MIIGSILLEAEQAVDGTTGDGYYGFLHQCVDGSHQWCHEWDGTVFSSRVEAVMQTYCALLHDWQYALKMDMWLKQDFQEVS